ncbi:CAAX prenyl protease 1 homolog [Euwallacea fornicatus]|uniref:CAAX prenyl protease 1 homolog n=1 Tax=Euwallacea fornicatus TaxID=995702 RepID=UPI0033903CE5
MSFLPYIDKLDDQCIKNLIVILLSGHYIWDTYLSIRQYKVAVNAVDIPEQLKGIMKTEEYTKARHYSIAKLKYGFVKEFQSNIINILMLYSNFFAIIWNYTVSINPFSDEVSTSCIWLTLLQLINTIIDLPFSIYYTFVLEEKFGFNKQTAGFFAWDKIKQFVVFEVISSTIASIVIVVVKNGGDYFFIWLWVVVGVNTLILLTIYPALIAPLFDKYTPLPDGELRTEIEALASSLKFPLTQLYVVEGSKRSSHSNAYFYGLFKSKRIVLFDTLLAKDDGSGCKDEEILAVLSHELGHWSRSHTIKNLILVQVNLFLLFAIFAATFKAPKLYTALGFYKTKPVLVGMFVVLQYVTMPYNTIISFFMTVLSRKFEFEADDFAVQLNKGKPLEKALVKLNKDNSGFPVHDWLYSAWHYSHPPLLQRIEVLREGVKKFEIKNK